MAVNDEVTESNETLTMVIHSENHREIIRGSEDRLLTAVEIAFDLFSLDSSSDDDDSLYISSDEDNSSTVSELTDDEYDEDLTLVDIQSQRLINDQSLMLRQPEALEAIEVTAKPVCQDDDATDAENDREEIENQHAIPVDEEQAEVIRNEADAEEELAGVADELQAEETVEERIENNLVDEATVEATQEGEIEVDTENNQPETPTTPAVAPAPAPVVALPLRQPLPPLFHFHRPAPIPQPPVMNPMMQPVFLGPRKKDGTPDFRYKLNRLHLYQNGKHYNIDGSLDKRYTCRH